MIFRFAVWGLYIPLFMSALALFGDLKELPTWAIYLAVGALWFIQSRFKSDDEEERVLLLWGANLVAVLVGVGLSIMHAIRYAQGARTEDVEWAMYAGMVGAAVAFVLMLLLQTYYRLAKSADGASDPS